MSRGTPDTSSYFRISPTGLSPSLITFPICSAILSSDHEVLYPDIYLYMPVWALPLSLATTQRIIRLFSFPPGT